jgi:hypothetical protein
MKKSLIVFFALVSVVATAQTDYIGIRAGVSWTDVIGKNFISFEDRDGRVGLSTGIVYEHEFKNRLTLGAEIVYNERGFIDYFVTNKISWPDVYNYNYLSFPIKIGYTFGNKVYGFGSIGLLPSRLLKSEVVYKFVDFQGNLLSTDKVDKTDQVQSFDFGGIIELGGGYKITPKWNVFTSLLYQRSNTDNTTEEYFDGRDLYHYGLTWSLGIKYVLKTQ